MKKHLLSLLTTAASLLAFNTSVMPAAAEDSPFSVSGNAMVRNRYVGFGNGPVLYSKAVIQSGLTINHNPTGLFYGIWASTGFNKAWSSGWDDEIDHTFGWSHSFGNYQFTVAEVYFDDFQVGEFAANDIWYTNVTLSRKAIDVTSWLSLSPYVQYEYYETVSGTPFKGGNLFGVGVGTSLKIAAKLSLDSTSGIKYDDGIGGGKTGSVFFKNSSTLNWSVNKNWTVNVIEATVWVPLSTGDSRSTECVLGTGVSFKF